jgi:hypothetical protein
MFPLVIGLPVPRNGPAVAGPETEVLKRTEDRAIAVGRRLRARRSCNTATGERQQACDCHSHTRGGARGQSATGALPPDHTVAPQLTARPQAAPRTLIDRPVSG